MRFKPIDPPSFSGLFRDWPKFRRGFEEIIVFNSHMSETEKNAYLFGALSGEPRRTLELMQNSHGSFHQNWSLIVRTYHNQKKIALDLLQGMTSAPKMANHSAEGVRVLHSTIKSCLQSFEELKIDTSSWDIWILDIVSRAFDADSRRLFEEQLEGEEFMVPRPNL